MRQFELIIKMFYKREIKYVTQNTLIMIGENI
jgi:hypothetical protein